MPVLVREAGRTFPGSLAEVDSWVPPWSTRQVTGVTPASPAAPAGPVADLLVAHPAVCDAVAELLGCDQGWLPAGRSGAGSPHPATAALLGRHPATTVAVADLLSDRNPVD